MIKLSFKKKLNQTGIPKYYIFSFSNKASGIQKISY